MSNRGKLIVVSGPSGSGKGTILGEVLKSPDYVYSISMTTRDPREGEIDGKHYFFVDKATFEEGIAKHNLIEYAVYNNNYYGTPKAKVMECLENGYDVILEIEVEGAMQIKATFPQAIAVMLTPPNREVLEARLRGRGTETEENIIKRLNKAKLEITYLPKYDYSVVNEDNGVEACADLVYSIIQEEHSKTVHTMEIMKNFE